MIDESLRAAMVAQVDAARAQASLCNADCCDRMAKHYSDLADRYQQIVDLSYKRIAKVFADAAQEKRNGINQ
jgi:hypothetical protein